MNESRSIGDDGSYIIQTMQGAKDAIVATPETWIIQGLQETKAAIAVNAHPSGYPTELHWPGEEEGSGPGLEFAIDVLCKELGEECRVATNWPIYPEVNWHPNTVIVIPPTSEVFDNPYFSYAQFQNGQVLRSKARLHHPSLFRQK